MLRFSVFDRDGPAKAWPLVNAHLLGPDDVGVGDDVSFADGLIHCRVPGPQAAALSLQYDAGAAGVLILQTCLLQQSERPYVLSHELARHRIKTFLVKCEEWQMFEMEAQHPAMRLWEEARELFTKGLNERDPVRMDRFGRRSLTKAIEATERLAVAHAEVLLHRRFGSKPASKNTLGVRIAPEKSPEAFSKLLSNEFDLIYIPLYWRDLERSEGEYDWQPVDRWMTWAHEQGRPVVAGPLIDFSARALPDWIYVWQHDYETCRDLVYDHIERVVNRYGNAVSIWSVAAGLNVNDNFEFTPDQMLDLTRMGSLLVRQRRRGRTMLEIVEPFGDRTGDRRDAIPPFTYIDRVIQEGIRIDCFGLQIAFGEGPYGLRARDLMQVSHLLDRFFLLEKPLLITSIGVPSRMPPNSEVGYWQEPWSPVVQSRWLGRVFGMTLSKPHVESFIWSALCDEAANDDSASGLYDRQGGEKPALHRLIEMRRRLRKPLGRLPSNAGVHSSR